jgi:hypothetical protein
MTPNIADIIRQYVSLEVRCIDRLHLHAYMPKLGDVRRPVLLPVRCENSADVGLPDSSRLGWARLGLEHVFTPTS